jgi:Type IV secretory pathway, VirB10 components
MSDPLNANASPGGLKKAGVVRLNRLPLLIILGFALLVVVLLVYAMSTRGQKSQTATTEVARVADTDAVRNKVLESFKGEAFIPPKEIPAAIPVAEPLAELPKMPDKPLEVKPLPVVPVEPVMTEEERRREQMRLQALQWQMDSYMKAVSAVTTVGDGGGAAAPTGGGGSPTQNLLAALGAGGATGTGALQQLLASAGSAAAASGTGGDDPNMQGRKEQFSGSSKDYGYSKEMVEGLVSPYVLRVGTLIPAVMVSGINSDLPGEIVAQVTQDVFDTAKGETVLLPQGSRLIGAYDNRVASGQERALVMWYRVMFPDGSVLALGNMGGVDQGGFAGFSDKVDRHLAETFRDASLLSLLSAGAQLAQPASDSPTSGESASEQMAAALGQQWSQVGMELVQQGMDRQPTLVIRPGYRFNVFINKDLLIPPYQHGASERG